MISFKLNKKLKSVLIAISIIVSVIALIMVLLMLILSYFVSIGAIDNNLGFIPSIEWIRTFGTLLSAIATVTLGVIAFTQNKKLNKQNEKMQTRISIMNREANEKALEIQHFRLLSNYYTYIKMDNVCRFFTRDKELTSKNKIKPTEVKYANFIDINTPSENISDNSNDIPSMNVMLFFENAGKNPLSQIGISSVEIMSVGNKSQIKKDYSPIVKDKYVNAPFYSYNPAKDTLKLFQKDFDDTYVLNLNLISTDSEFWQNIEQHHYMKIKIHMYILSIFNVAIEGDLQMVISNRDRTQDGTCKILSSNFTACDRPYELLQFDENK